MTIALRVTLHFLILFLFSLPVSSMAQEEPQIRLGIEKLDELRYDLQYKNVAVVANHTSLINGVHLVDTLLSEGVNVIKVFAPEHGFRGKADAGQHLKNSKDKKTGLKIVSLYGRNKKPSYDHLADVDVVVFDIQDVGVRFYTYISTMHYVMEACAEMEKQVIVLDRPNPNGFYVDGPVLEEEFTSFVGMHPIPLVHGLTVGELALMINGEGWLAGGLTCNLKVYSCDGYQHGMRYDLPVAPSPNLPNMSSIYLYPNLGLFEGTLVSVGRGTAKPFQHIGSPYFAGYDYTFTPKPSHGAKHPKHNGKKCFGFDLEEFGGGELPNKGELYLHWLDTMYKGHRSDLPFFLENNFFNLLAGNATLQQQIKDGVPIKDIRASWQPALQSYLKKRKNYLLYPDF